MTDKKELNSVGYCLKISSNSERVSFKEKLDAAVKEHDVYMLFKKKIFDLNQKIERIEKDKEVLSTKHKRAYNRNIKDYERLALEVQNKNAEAIYKQIVEDDKFIYVIDGDKLSDYDYARIKEKSSKIEDHQLKTINEIDDLEGSLIGLRAMKEYYIDKCNNYEENVGVSISLH